jgi:ABC-2 type transport system permease protein
MKRIIGFFRDALHIGGKDLKDFYRDRARIISFLIMPIFMMLLTGFIFPSQSSLKNLPVGLINQDGGPVSEEMISVFSQMKTGDTNVMKLKPLASEDEAKQLIKEQRISGALVFPEGLSDSLKNKQQGQVIIVTDQSNPQISSLLTGMLEQALSGMGTQMETQAIADMTGGRMPQEAITAMVTPIQVQTRGLIAGNPNYFQFVAPGVMAMVTVMAVMMGLAGSVAREKETGTLDGLLVAPIARGSIVMGKTFAQTVRGLAQGAMVLAIAMIFFGVRVYGNFALLVVMLILGIFSFVGLGILISAMVEEQETAMTIMMTVTFPMLFLSGAFFPLQQMPGFMQAISKVVPLTYVVEGLRQVMVLGAGFTQVLRPVLILLAFGAVTLAISIPAFKRVVTR